MSNSLHLAVILRIFIGPDLASKKSMNNISVDKNNRVFKAKNIPEHSQSSFLLSIVLGLFCMTFSLFANAAPGGVQYLNNLKNQKIAREQQAAFEQYLNAQISFIEGLGYQPWQWLESDCSKCKMMIVPLKLSMRNSDVLAYASTISKEKNKLTLLYHSDSQEYNLLATIAMGILGRESEFFQSPRYQFKEAAPWLIQMAKYANHFLNGKKVLPNSRGPTQIKIVPKIIADFYGVTSENIHEPRNAALATMGFLIEALKELKQRAENRNLEFITPETYADYLPYIYFGGTRMLVNRKATPEKNIYIRDMKKYMSWVQIYEQRQ